MAMRFPAPLIRGTLQRRYKRFLADVRLEDGSEVTVHCANTGAMLGCSETGAEVWISPVTNPRRKQRYTWEMIRVGNTLVGVNTARPNALVAEAVAAHRIPELTGYEIVRREVGYGTRARIDLLLSSAVHPTCYVEVKSVTLRRVTSGPVTAEFPDAVTTRGTKHLWELTSVVANGARAVLVFLVQRNDCQRFRIATDIDPTYALAFAMAMAKGVEAVCYSCTLNPEGIALAGTLPIEHLDSTPLPRKHE